MADDLKHINVKNVSVRLVHLGGVAIPPNVVAPVVDDKLGINRADIESSQWLELTDDDITPGHELKIAKVESAKKSTKAAAAEAKVTPTGTGWSPKG